MAVTLAVLGRATPAEPEKTGLNQRGYVWQRAWSPAFRADLREHGPAFAALDVLVTELSWRDAAAVTASAQPDWPGLAATGRPIGVVVRVGPYHGSFEENSPATRAVIDACKQALARARAAGLEPEELQLDFDAASRRLGDYQTWLKILRRTVHPPRLVITVLPDWLRAGDFARLIQEVDAYVLQVHSLEKPVSATQPYVLCDPVQVPRWIQAASAFGKSFRVALPTYGYQVAFSRDDRFLGLQAEGPARTWPAGHVLRTVLPEPAPLADFIRDLRDHPPASCTGVVWFRLPSPDDSLAWRWPTLASVMHGDPPVGQPTLSVHEANNGTWDLTVRNEGTAHATLPKGFRVHWPGARLIAADALGGWKLERHGPDELILQPPLEARSDLLFPGDSREVGWLRLDAHAAIDAAPLD